MKKLLAVVLSVAMLLSMLPGTAFAADTAPSELPSDISGYSLKMTDVGTLTYNGKVQNPVAGIEKDGTSYTLAPVSYTHLDVYKRQAQQYLFYYMRENFQQEILC